MQLGYSSVVLTVISCKVTEPGRPARFASKLSNPSKVKVVAVGDSMEEKNWDIKAGDSGLRWEIGFKHLAAKS